MKIGVQAALRRPLVAARVISTIAEDACFWWLMRTRTNHSNGASMAEVISIQGTTATAKIRNPIVAFLLVFVTLGIYYLVWYYKINRELRDLGRATGQEERLGRSPFTSLMAITFGWLILVPPFVSMYRTLKRIQAAQEISGTTGEPINVWLGFLLYLVGVFTLPVEILYAQSELNRLWRTAPEAPGGRRPPPDEIPPLPQPRRLADRPPDHLSTNSPRRDLMSIPSTTERSHEPRPPSSRPHASLVARRDRRSRSLLLGPPRLGQPEPQLHERRPRLRRPRHPDTNRPVVRGRRSDGQQQHHRSRRGDARPSSSTPTTT